MQFLEALLAMLRTLFLLLLVLMIAGPIFSAHGALFGAGAAAAATWSCSSIAPPA